MSAATIWEIEIKRALGRLTAPDDAVERVESSGFEPLPINLEHAREAGRLPLHHSDPFDRILIAQARVEDLSLATADEAMTRYGVAVLPVARA